MVAKREERVSTESGRPLADAVQGDRSAPYSPAALCLVVAEERISQSSGLYMTAAEEQVTSWGFSSVYTWTDRPRAHYPAHSHAGKTTHLILKGSLEYTYPDETEGQHKVYCKAGDRWDVEAHKRHEVWIGNEGCTYVIGE